MAAEVTRDRGAVRGERLNDGLSAVTAGEGPPLVLLPGFGHGADLAVRVPLAVALSTVALKAASRARHSACCAAGA